MSTKRDTGVPSPGNKTVPGSSSDQTHKRNQLSTARKKSGSSNATKADDITRDDNKSSRNEPSTAGTGICWERKKKGSCKHGDHCAYKAVMEKKAAKSSDASTQGRKSKRACLQWKEKGACSYGNDCIYTHEGLSIESSSAGPSFSPPLEAAKPTDRPTDTNLPVPYNLSHEHDLADIHYRRSPHTTHYSKPTDRPMKKGLPTPKYNLSYEHALADVYYRMGSL